MAETVTPKIAVRRKIDFDRIGNKILVLLYQRYMGSDSFFIAFDEIRALIPDEPKNAIWDELRTQVENKNVHQKTEQRSQNAYAALINPAGRNETYTAYVDGYKISRKGIDIVAAMTEEAYEVLASEVLSEPYKKTAESEKWEPLPLDRQSTEYKKALEATEAAITEIESSNGYAASSPEERNSIVDTLRNNLKLLRDGLISKGQLLEGLIKPLRYVALKFAEASMGELAKRAANFLVGLFS